MTEWTPPEFPIDTETFVSTIAQIAATQGDATAVAVLAEATASIKFADSHSDYGREWYYFRLQLDVDAGLYGRLGIVRPESRPDAYGKPQSVREELCERLGKLTSEVSRAHDESMDVSSVAIAPMMTLLKDWRPQARAYIRGEGINNQGRVRSDNIAARQHDGLLFRSEPEVLLYDALKAKGVYLAPLPVFLRGGATYQRLEPDFVLLHKGVVMVVEIDGATVHRESPAEAHARTQGLQRDGVRVERVPASDCATKVAAEQCARRLIEALEGYRELRV